MKKNFKPNPGVLRGRLGMVMERINGFSNLSKGILERFQGSSRSESCDHDEAHAKEARGSKARPTPLDRAEISAKAHHLMNLRQAVDKGREALADVPEVRPDRVAEVRARLGRGFYNSTEVRNRVAERLDDVNRNLEEL